MISLWCGDTQIEVVPCLQWIIGEARTVPPFTDCEIVLRMSGAKKPAAPKTAKLKEGVEDIVLQWFKDCNRPATTQGVVDALGSRIAKGTCQKALDGLTEQKSLLVKEVKKAKYYYLDQEKLLAAEAEQSKNPSDSSQPNKGDAEPPSEEMIRMQELRSEFVQRSKNQQKCAETLAQLHARRTRSDAKNMMDELLATLEAAQKRLAVLSASAGDGTNANWSLIKETYSSRRSVWRERKQMCDQIIDAVAGDGPRDEVVENSGVVLDSDVGVSFEGSAVNLRKRGR